MRMNRAAATGDKALINALKKERQLIAASNVTRDQHRDLERAMQARLDANGLNSAVVSTLKEQEADEVGLELFVRAGFKPEQYGFMQRHYAIHMENSSVFEKAIRLARSNSESELSLECLKIRQLKVMGLPYRGRWTRADEPYRVAPGRTESHPLPCWRLYNIKHNEMKEHADEIAKLGRDVKEPTALTAPSLVEVQAEIGIDPGTVRILGGKGEPGPTPPDSQEKARSRDDEKVERDSGTIEIPVFYPISY
ncbi:MAG: hypothetical protein NTV34_05170 [Proteobacteria bacterium]|nr:hypothetical protein [Pseudomonadota bacterium]